MIPSFSVSGVLPPFVGNDPTFPAAQAPYRTSMTEVVQRFSFNLERIAILEGLFDYREKMRSLNVTGYQWLDGSFVEDCENTRNRPPADIDVITFAYRPINQDGHYLNKDDFELLTDQHPELFDPDDAKDTYKCDAYYVDFNQAPHSLASSVTYWCNLFSHSRINNLWKGIIQVELNADDTDAKAILSAKKQSLLAVNVGGDNA
ncbi:hypothetical protein SAMN05428958_107255 [Pantoea sesami]|nr:hypothetical protein SAMN05428958_107255 [Pantoea sesami]